VTAGLRRGELLGLKWEDLDLEAGTLEVRRSLRMPVAAVRSYLPRAARAARYGSHEAPRQP
jgi:integrase